MGMADEKRCGCGERLAGRMPPLDIDFRTFILSLSSSALVHLGEAPDPTTGEVTTAPHLAKHTIDVLAMLQDKFRSGLSEEEAKLLCDILYNLRMTYVNTVE
jgi:hypothetical protein